MRIYNMLVKQLNNKTFNIFGEKYVIHFVDTLDIPDDDTSHYGLTNNPKKEIQIALNVKGNKQSDNELKITLIHEIVHCIFDGGCYFNSSDDESLVEWTAKCIVSLLKQGILCK